MFDREQSRQEREWMKREIPITEYAASLGFTLVRRGRFVSTKEHDSIMIDPATNTYRQFSKSPYKKSIIDFSMEFENKSLAQATRDLMSMWKKNRGILETPSRPAATFHPSPPRPKTEFHLPERDSNHRNVYAYLTQTRKIDGNIVQQFLHRQLLYQEKEHKNCVFVGYDQEQKPVFGSMRGTHSEKRFVRDIDGSDYQQGMYIDNGKNTLIVTESAIDCMSVMSLALAKGNDPNNSNYLILSGASKLTPLFYHVENHPQIDRVILALDYDDAGMQGTEIARHTLRNMGFSGSIVDAFPKLQKDWNDELQYIKEHRLRADYFAPNQKQQALLSAYCADLLRKKRNGTPVPEEQKQIIELTKNKVPDGVLDTLKNAPFPDLEQEGTDASQTVSNILDKSILYYNSGGTEPPGFLQMEEPVEVERLTMKIPKSKQMKKGIKKSLDIER